MDTKDIINFMVNQAGYSPEIAVKEAQRRDPSGNYEIPGDNYAFRKSLKQETKANNGRLNLNSAIKACKDYSQPLSVMGFGIEYESRDRADEKAEEINSMLAGSGLRESDRVMVIQNGASYEVALVLPGAVQSSVDSQGAVHNKLYKLLHDNGIELAPGRAYSGNDLNLDSIMGTY